MNTTFFYSLIVMLGLSSACQPVADTMDRDITFLNSTIHLSTDVEGKSLLNTSDEFTQSLSVFDFASKTGDKTKNSEQDYLDFAGEQAKDWKAKDADKIKKMVVDAESKIKALGLNLNLPSRIDLILSSCKEEGGAAGYTRGDYIVVRSVPDEHLFLHELFHVFSRENPTKRDEIYAILGFVKCQKLEYPADLQSRKITNPDAPFFEHYVELDVLNETKKVMFLTIANDDYESGSFFNYLQMKLLELDENNVAKKDSEGKAITHFFEDASDLTDKIGTNTDYNIHPEEISAEHFTFLVLGNDIPEPSYIDQMKAILVQ